MTYTSVRVYLNRSYVRIPGNEAVDALAKESIVKGSNLVRKEDATAYFKKDIFNTGGMFTEEIIMLQVDNSSRNYVYFLVRW